VHQSRPAGRCMPTVFPWGKINERLLRAQKEQLPLVEAFDMIK